MKIRELVCGSTCCSFMFLSSLKVTAIYFHMYETIIMMDLHEAFDVIVVVTVVHVVCHRNDVYRVRAHSSQYIALSLCHVYGASSTM